MGEKKSDTTRSYNQFIQISHVFFMTVRLTFVKIEP